MNSKKTYLFGLGTLIAVIAFIWSISEFSSLSHPSRHETSSAVASAGDADPEKGSRAEFERLLSSKSDLPVDDGNEAMRLELIETDAFFDVYQRLINLPPDSLKAHESFYLAYILETCSRSAAMPGQTPSLAALAGPRSVPSQRSEEAKDRVQKRSLSRLCSGIDLGGSTAQLISDLFHQAAEQGGCWLRISSVAVGHWSCPAESL